jgi:hypothetical protein
MAKKTYHAFFEGHHFTRKTHRTYTHVVICREAKFLEDRPDDPRRQKDGKWYVIGWAGRLDLAEKKAKTERRAWGQVKIVPCEVI